MYTFTDRENRSFTLRPEGTAGVARAVIENGKLGDALPLRLYYLISCFRYEKPQAGRSREFYQFGVEMFGAGSAMADASTIALANAIINRLGITNVKLSINSIGCPECRPKYHAALVDYFSSHKDALCPTCRERLATNPLRILDCKNPECKALASDAPRTVDHLCGECSEHFETLKAALEGMGIAYTVDPQIVRGLDYYTRTVFEFVCDAIGAQGTVCGGGRYDGLIEEIGGAHTPGIGFAMGITRLILAMKACGVELEEKRGAELYIAPMGGDAQLAAMEITEKLRRKGIAADCDIFGRSLKAQMKYADKTGAGYTLIIGSSELESGRAQLKRMSDSTQTEVNIFDTEEIIKAIE